MEVQLQNDASNRHLSLMNFMNWFDGVLFYSLIKHEKSWKMMVAVVSWAIWIDRNQGLPKGYVEKSMA